MAYSELIKNFNRIRSYMREFYIYGFKNREQYSDKSARSYDNERRRIKSRLGDISALKTPPTAKTYFYRLTAALPLTIRYTRL